MSARTIPATDSRWILIGHAIVRMRQRYGMYLTNAEYFRLCRVARKPSRKRLAVTSPRTDDKRMVVAVRWRGRWLAVVWDAGLRLIVTALPLSSIAHTEAWDRIKRKAG